MGEIILTSKRQREIFKKLRLAEFGLLYKITAKNMDMPLSTIFHSWRAFRKHNAVHIALVVNGEEVMRKPLLDDGKKVEIAANEDLSIDLDDEEMDDDETAVLNQDMIDTLREQ